MSKKIEGKYPLTHFPHNKELTKEERERAYKKAHETLFKRPKTFYCICDICGERYGTLDCVVLPVKSDWLVVCKKCNTPPLSDNLVKLTAEDYGIND